MLPFLLLKWVIYFCAIATVLWAICLLPVQVIIDGNKSMHFVYMPIFLVVTVIPVVVHFFSPKPLYIALMVALSEAFVITAAFIGHRMILFGQWGGVVSLVDILFGAAYLCNLLYIDSDQRLSLWNVLWADDTQFCTDVKTDGDAKFKTASTGDVGVKNDEQEIKQQVV